MRVESTTFSTCDDVDTKLQKKSEKLSAVVSNDTLDSYSESDKEGTHAPTVGVGMKVFC